MRAARPGSFYSALVCLLSLACAEEATTEDPGGAQTGAIQVVQVIAPSLVVEGSLIQVETRGLTASDLPLRLQVGTQESAVLFVLDEVEAKADGALRVFEFSRTAVDSLGEGEHGLLLTLVQGQDVSAPVPKVVDVRKELQIALSEVTEGAVWIMSRSCSRSSRCWMISMCSKPRNPQR